MAAIGSIGFRPTEEDDELIRAHKRPDETITDVLRRALRALDRESWEQQARADMERIAGEDLSEEPDDWVYGETGEPIDVRSQDTAARSVPPELGRVVSGWPAGVLEQQRGGPGPSSHLLRPPR
ncbi:hypothetical protein ACQPXT_13620 [Streptomyces sp. CA-100214]